LDKFRTFPIRLSLSAQLYNCDVASLRCAAASLTPTYAASANASLLYSHEYRCRASFVDVDFLGIVHQPLQWFKDKDTDVFCDFP
jgi:hypothetical protein